MKPRKPKGMRVRQLVFSGTKQPVDYVCETCVSIVPDLTQGCLVCKNREQRRLESVERSIERNKQRGNV
jgi:hypothetical protein